MVTAPFRACADSHVPGNVKGQAAAGRAGRRRRLRPRAGPGRAERDDHDDGHQPSQQSRGVVGRAMDGRPADGSEMRAGPTSWTAPGMSSLTGQSGAAWSAAPCRRRCLHLPVRPAVAPPLTRSSPPRRVCPICRPPDHDHPRRGCAASGTAIPQSLRRRGQPRGRYRPRTAHPTTAGPHTRPQAAATAITPPARQRGGTRHADRQSTAVSACRSRSVASVMAVAPSGVRQATYPSGRTSSAPSSPISARRLHSPYASWASRSMTTPRRSRPSSPARMSAASAQDVPARPVTTEKLPLATRSSVEIRPPLSSTSQAGGSFAPGRKVGRPKSSPSREIVSIVPSGMTAADS